ncbi:MAG: RNA-binding S4 domain-containing protein [Granulosicoccus sp.]
MNDVVMRQEPVELYRILKFEGWVNSGGEAKQAIAAGFVHVNGEIETRKRRKILAGDVISYRGKRCRMVL